MRDERPGTLPALDEALRREIAEGFLDRAEAERGYLGKVGFRRQLLAQLPKPVLDRGEDAVAKILMLPALSVARPLVFFPELGGCDGIVLHVSLSLASPEIIDGVEGNVAPRGQRMLDQ